MDIAHYQRTTVAITETGRIMRNIDLIEGGIV